MRALLRPLLAAVAVLALAACGTADAGTSGRRAVDLSSTTKAPTLRLGYFANVTHAPAIIADREGLLARELGATKVETQIFGAGPAAIEALNAGAIDAAFLGPNPAINAFVRSNGNALRIVSGATAGGAQLVVRDGITDAAQLKGTNLASPQLGNTQDVALRAWLADQGLRTSTSGGGDVTVTPTDNAVTLQLFRDGRLDGAWVPEPWASRLVLEGGGHVLVDEASLWPKGRFVTTHLVVSTTFLREHPGTVEALIRAEIAAIDWIATSPAQAQAEVNAAISEANGDPLPDEVLDRAFANIAFTPDPVAASLQTSFDHSVAAGITRKDSLNGIYDLRLLNKVLAGTRGGSHRPISAAGLGED
jgi:NitT/TauT family transport system substrate-binding protein